MALELFVFIAVFAVIILVYYALSAGETARRRQTAERLAAIPLLPGIERGDTDELLLDQPRSSVGWIDRLSKQQTVFVNLQDLLLGADSKWSVPQFLAYSLISALVGYLAAYWRTEAVLPAVALAFVTASGPLLYILQQRRARVRKFERMLPDSLDLMVSSLRAGHGLLSAIGMVAREASPPISVEFRKCFDEQNFGLDLSAALEHLSERIPLHDVQIVVAAILIQKECGGNLAEILEKVSKVIRERFRLKRQIQVHTAQGRMTGWILALLPVFLGFAMYLVNPTYMSRLWSNEIGVDLMYAASVMTVLGALIIRKIVNVRI